MTQCPEDNETQGAKFTLVRKDHHSGGALALWHRQKGQPWRVVAESESSRELTGMLADLPSGESITLPLGSHPNDKRKESKVETIEEVMAKLALAGVEMSVNDDGRLLCRPPGCARHMPDHLDAMIRSRRDEIIKALMPPVGVKPECRSDATEVSVKLAKQHFAEIVERLITAGEPTGPMMAVYGIMSDLAWRIAEALAKHDETQAEKSAKEISYWAAKAKTNAQKMIKDLTT
jgi:hypothetical protein